MTQAWSIGRGEHERGVGATGGDGIGVGDGAWVELGLVAYTAMGREGQTGCEGTEWESETSVRCLVGQELGARGGW